MIITSSLRLLLLLAISGSLLNGQSLISIPMKQIERCFQSVTDSAAEGQRDAAAAKPFFLYYHDNAVEAFNVISPTDYKRIRRLVLCIEREDSRLFEDRSSDKHQHRHGGSNVTYLTGMFQHFLPDMRHTLRDNMRKAFRRADWTDDIDRLGIRSVQYLSFEKAGLKAHMEGVRARKEAAQEKQKYFVVYPDEESKRHTLQQQTGLDEESDEAMAQYLHGSEGSTIVAYISLSDRNNFAGGEILARRIAERPKKRPTGAKRSVEDIPQEEEDMDPEQDGWNDAHVDEIAAEEAVFDISRSNINRFTPEKSSALYIRPGAGCGMKPVSVGARKLLLIEFWPYVDAAIGASRPRLDDAVSWPRGGGDDL